MWNLDMWSYIGLGIVLLWIYFTNKKSSRDTMLETDTKEFVWKVKVATETLQQKDATLANADWTFASAQWSAVLGFKDGSLVLTLDCSKNVFSSYPENVFLGAGVCQSRDEMLFYWHEVKVWAPYALRGWRGPSGDFLLQNKECMLPDDVLTVFVRLSTFPSPFCVVSKNSEGNDAVENDKSGGVGGGDISCHNCKALKNLSMNLKDLYQEDKEPDVNIIVRNEKIGAHRAILKARSPVLAALITQETPESKSGDHLEEDCDPKAFADFLLFLYSGTVDHLTSENVTSVFNIADKYEVLDLMEACAKYMLSEMTVHSVSNVIAVALKYKDFKLLDRATEFFMQHAEEIFPTAEWVTFLGQNPTKANELVIKSYSYKKSKDV